MYGSTETRDTSVVRRTNPRETRAFGRAGRVNPENPTRAGPVEISRFAGRSVQSMSDENPCPRSKPVPTASLSRARRAPKVRFA